MNDPHFSKYIDRSSTTSFEWTCYVECWSDDTNRVHGHFCDVNASSEEDAMKAAEHDASVAHKEFTHFDCIEAYPTGD
jgi:hypothetical protein